jgi:2-C-methyl-D-erythritol 2,4-cyclodiphosphate synthase
MNPRIGQGIDFHRLEKGLKLWLGGILIPSEKGCIAHSDGDVLLHAVCDSLLGAAGEPDIGSHFPDTDPEYKNIRSTILLERTYSIIRK